MPHKDPAAAKEYFRQYHIKNRERILAASKAYREANPEKVAAGKKKCYDRIKNDPEFKRKMSERQKRLWRENPEHMKAIARRSYQKNRKKILAKNKIRSNTPERKAREALNRAVKNGNIPRAKTLECSICGKGATQYHHPNYDKSEWLNVVPVCGFCHNDLHGNQN